MVSLAVQKPVEGVGVDTSYGAAFLGDEENVGSDGGRAGIKTPSESSTDVTKLVASFFPRVVTLVVMVGTIIALAQRFPGNDVPNTAGGVAATTTLGAAVNHPAQQCDSDGLEQQNAKVLEPGVLG